MNKNLYKLVSEQQLLDNFYADRDNKWIGVLLERYTLLLLGVCMKYLKNEEEAKDAVQQIFFKVIVEIEKYRVNYFKSWIYMIAKNYCLMYLRKKQGNVTLQHIEGTISEELSSEDRIYEENDELKNAIFDALGELKNEQKQCITLFYLEKKSYHEIADKTGFTLLQVKSYIQNGKRNLRLMLEKKMDQYNEQ